MRYHDSLLSPIDLQNRRVFDNDGLLQAVVLAAQSGAYRGSLSFAAALAHDPLFVQEQLGPQHRRVKRQAVIQTESVAQRDAHLTIDSGKVADPCQDTGTAH